MTRAVTYIRVIIANGFAGKPARKTDKTIAHRSRCLEPTLQRYCIQKIYA
jgi:hypothetical protein